MSQAETPMAPPIRLLLVDDEREYVKVLSKRLARRRFDVTFALTGSDAIRAMRKQDFDIVVLYLKLTDMDGIEDALLGRPVVDDPRARNALEKAKLGRPIIDGLVRNWYPGQSLESLLAENHRLLSGGDR